MTDERLEEREWWEQITDVLNEYPTILDGGDDKAALEDLEHFWMIVLHIKSLQEKIKEFILSDR